MHWLRKRHLPTCKRYRTPRLRMGMDGWKSAPIGPFATERSWSIWTRKRSGKACKLWGLGMLRSERRFDHEVSRETHYFLLSFSSALTFAYAVRSHWGIENCLHWVLDVPFREDDSRVRLGHSSANLAVLRLITVNLLRQEKSSRVGIHAKRLKAGWDHTSLLRVLDGLI